ncbi:hypothetical protein ACR79T_10085 [Sphingobacterium spiritivorum]|uniref:hypothetical protein n=1 Tax=Sphingobacterium spiritivorum TaxID=258 RepID=UPI003DA69500
MKTTIKPLTPFQKNLKGEPIDLNKEEDVQLTLKRNKRLQEALECGLTIGELEVKPRIMINFQCVKCGTNIQNSSKAYDDSTGIYGDWGLLFVDLYCGLCNTSYRYCERDLLIKASLPKVYKAKKS